MKDASVDELMGALFPGEKLPPSTAGTTKETGAPAQLISQNSWDESDEESPRKQLQQLQQRRTEASAASTTAAAQQPVKPGPPPQLPTTSNNLQAAEAPTTTKTISPVQFVAKASAQWPTLPRSGLVKFCDNKCILASRISQRDLQVHHRVMFGGTTTDGGSSAAAESDGSIRDNTIAWYCPYMRCKKCDHPVVRLQDAYVVETKKHHNHHHHHDHGDGARNKNNTKDNKNSSPSDANNNSKQHDWDDSDEDAADVVSGLTSGGDGGNVTPMYMLSRNHFPDFIALERTGAMRRTSVSAAETCALYWCQCTIASCCADGIPLDAASATAGTALHPAALEFQRKSGLSDVPYSATEIRWVCVGHHPPKI